MEKAYLVIYDSLVIPFPLSKDLWRDLLATCFGIVRPPVKDLRRYRIVRRVQDGINTRCFPLWNRWRLTPDQVEPMEFVRLGRHDPPIFTYAGTLICGEPARDVFSQFPGIAFKEARVKARKRLEWKGDFYRAKFERRLTLASSDELEDLMLNLPDDTEAELPAYYEMFAPILPDVIDQRANGNGAGQELLGMHQMKAYVHLAKLIDARLLEDFPALYGRSSSFLLSETAYEKVSRFFDPRFFVTREIDLRTGEWKLAPGQAT